MKRITGVLAGVALAGTMSVGVATSASAAPLGAGDAKITCPGQVLARSVWVDCPGSTPGTQFRALAYCVRPSGATFRRSARGRTRSGAVVRSPTATTRTGPTTAPSSGADAAH